MGKAGSSKDRPWNWLKVSLHSTSSSSEQQQHSNSSAAASMSQVSGGTSSSCSTINMPAPTPTTLTTITDAAATESRLLEEFEQCEQDILKWCESHHKKDYPKDKLRNLLDTAQLAPFLTDVISEEVEACESLQTLFRGNTLASKIMTHTFKIFGSTYLKQILEPHLTTLLDNENKTDNNNLPGSSSGSSGGGAIKKTFSVFVPSKRSQQAVRRTQSSVSYEIDSTRLDADANIEENQRNLLKLTKAILDSILSSAEVFPSQLNTLCVCLRQVLSEKYPQASNLTSVATVIFLRFINPAIISPVDAGIVDRQPTMKTVRGLTFVSKILQNIANHVIFTKEEHMLPFNDFVRDHFEPVVHWVDKVSTVPS